MSLERTLKSIEIPSLAIRFAGDSGDGMQLTGTQFTNTAAILGNDIATLPDFPAEIRAPAGSLPGVSAFQLHFSDHEIHTPGDVAHVLVAMNPAALKVHLSDLEEGGLLIVDTDAFIAKNLRKAGFDKNPLEEGSLSTFNLLSFPLTTLTHNALKDLALSKRETERCKNLFVLGLLYYLYDRSLEHTQKWLENKFKQDHQLCRANLLALHAGFNYADTVELAVPHYRVQKAKLPPGKYRKVTGNEATVLGLVTASQVSGLPLFYGSYPITPASDILHELSRLKRFAVKTFQAEDEISAICSCLGAAFSGSLGVTASSGPGIALKMEAINLAVMTELPVVIIDVQRAGPSTGMPTKPEQADLWTALFGRPSESSVPVIAAATPGDCFNSVMEALRIAVQYRTPVFFMSDGYLANGAEPWKIPDISALPKIEANFSTDPNGFFPYSRDQKTLARPWSIPGTPGLEHCIGGLEKEHITGNVSYDPKNHEAMVKIRAEKIARIADDIPLLKVRGDAEGGELLIVGWGSTYGAITTAVDEARSRGLSVSAIHLRHLNPFPKNLGELLRQFKKVLVPELNLGQLLMMLRSRFLVDAIGYHKVQGKPFKVSEIREKIEEVLLSVRHTAA